MNQKLYLERAENEQKLANILFTLSTDPSLQAEMFNIEAETYYSAVIGHCYYSIFYVAKAYLLSKNIKLDAPHEHKKAFEAFKNFVDSGELDVELLIAYKETLYKAEYLLGIYLEEKKKRGKYTYKTLPQANREPAKQSISHAMHFYTQIATFLKGF